MSGRREYETLFKLDAQLGGGYSGTFSKAQKQLLDMQRELDSLNRRQSDISAFEKQQGAVEATEKKLGVLQRQYDNIRREMESTGEFSSSLANKMLEKQQQVDRASASLEAQREKLGKLGEGLRSAGIDTGSLGAASAELSGKVGRLREEQDRATESAGRFGESSSGAFGALQQAVAAAGVAVALREVFRFFSDCTSAAIEFEHVMAGVRRTVGGSDGDMAAMSAEFKAMALDIPITTSELGKIAETAGQLGVAREDVAGFTRIMAMLGTTTDLTADNAATMLAQFANITGLDPKDYDRLGATVASLGDATATTASKVVDMSQGLAAAASIAGMSETDILGIAAAVGSLGIEAQAGGTAMSALIQTLYKATETGDKLEEFADVAKMSASEFRAAWGEDAVMAMDAFIRGLNDTERNGRSAIVILDELGITNIRQTKAVLGLANAEGLLSDTVRQGGKAWADNVALQEKAGIMYGTTHSQLVLMQNAYAGLQVSLGEVFTPILHKLYAVVADLLNGVSGFVERHPALVKAMSAFVAVIGLTVGALAAYAVAAKVAAAASKLLSSAIPGLNVIMAVTAAVAGLVSAVTFFASASKEAESEVRGLSATSRGQYYELRDLEREYVAVCGSMGEASAEAQLVKRSLDEASAAFEANKMTVEDAARAHEDFMSMQREIALARKENIDGASKEGQGVVILASKLNELVGAEGKTAAVKQQILSIVGLLNEAMPELSLRYDDYSDSLNVGAQALEAFAKAEADRLLNASKYDELVKAQQNQIELEKQLEAAAQARAYAYEQNEKASEQYFIALKSSSNSLGGAIQRDAYKTLWNDAYSELARANDELGEVTAKAEGNRAAIEALSLELAGYTSASDDGTRSTIMIQDALSDAKARMDALAAAYSETYDSALKSVSGQYKLWEGAADVVAVSVDTISAALEGQAEYWRNYNANLASLAGKAADIEGLGDVISSFADGSADSVNAVAGMAAATDEELAAMVGNWKELQVEHEAVAGSLAQLETDFETSMEALQGELEAAVTGMSLGEEAAESGRHTIQGFIDGAEGMLPAVEAAYRQIAKAGIAAIDKAMDSHSPSRVMFERGEFAMAGFTGGVESMKPEVSQAMSEAAKAGSSAFVSEEAQFVALAPQLLGAMSALSARRDSAEADGGGGGSVYYVTLSPEYHFGGGVSPEGIDEAISASNDRLRELVEEALNDIGADEGRRAYR